MGASKKPMRTNSKLKSAFIGVAFFIILFFTNKELRLPYYINVSAMVAYIPLFLGMLAMLFLNRNCRIDTISMILAARLFIYIFPIIYLDNLTGYWGNYFSVIASFIAYLICSQNHFDDISAPINQLFAVFLSLVSLQVIYLFVILRMQFGILSIGLSKLYMVTPVGGSNYIASVILPLMVFMYYSSIRLTTKLVVLAISVVAIVLIQSKNAVLVIILFLCIRLIKVYLKAIKSSNSNKNKVTLVTIVLFMSAVAGVYYSLRFFLIEWHMGMSYNPASLYETINALTSNRLDVYSKEFNRWTDHMILGNGLAYDVGMTRSHNWIIELLVHSGLLGFSVYIIAILKWFRKTRRYIKKSSFVRSTHYAALIILVQGLAEVSLFTTSIDMIFWILIGLSMSEVQRLQRLEQTEESG